MSDTSEPSEFIPYSEAATALGVTSETLRQRLKKIGVAPYQDPRDNRRRLIGRSDFDAISTPKPAPPRRISSPVAGGLISGD